MKDDNPSIETMRTQRDEIERQLAQATIAPMQEFLALLGSDEITEFLDRLASAASPLEERTRRQVTQWASARTAMVKIGDIELARLRKLVD
ncbi:hypothetical protein [Novosphingobium sp. AP12]|uniref:hypothetical protein n=1 Tax=Novosphingobium sp. AP12 TaxID=1144305 RepID=UPI000271DDF5|nr:hypothetical protein [Novosphingobium sp. AP12]EJL21887.1 hypothetical protein PMI02_04872 [Novosphingobium sp. AP12]EJL23687.1 hypothetical protein PMI02_04030 [Novosphingobium sp. AP12]